MSLTARGEYRIVAVLRDVDPCPGLPHCARRQLLAERSTFCENCDVPKLNFGVLLS